MRRIFLTMAATTVLSAAAMPPAYAGQDQFIGMLTGAGLGGYAGSQFGRGSGQVAAATAGVLFGGYVGSNIGQSMDRANALSYSYGSSSYSSSLYYPGSVYYSTNYAPNYVAPPAPPPAPATTYIDDQSVNYCREYSQLVRIGDRVEESYGTACLQPDGSWRVVQ